MRSIQTDGVVANYYGLSALIPEHLLNSTLASRAETPAMALRKWKSSAFASAFVSFADFTEVVSETMAYGLFHRACSFLFLAMSLSGAKLFLSNAKALLVDAHRSFCVCPRPARYPRFRRTFPNNSILAFRPPT
jgi:hypothetical protein